MEAVSEILRTMRLAGAVFLDAEFTAPWRVNSHVDAREFGAMMPAPAGIIAYHYVVEGSMWVRVGANEVRHVAARQLVILPRNDVSSAGSTEDIDAIDSEKLVEPAGDDGLMRIRHGGGGSCCKIYCGYLGTSDGANPLLQTLPRVLMLDLQRAAAGDWIEGSMRYAVQQLMTGPPQTAAELGRLAELLFAEAIREYLWSLDESDRGWLTALKDPVLGKALALLHGQLSRAWSLQTLSEEVATSRSALAERFRHHLGVSPIRYLQSRRLQRAADRLACGDDLVSRIAAEAGYESEAAFNRAFKREFGEPPAAFRKARRQAAGAGP